MSYGLPRRASGQGLSEAATSARRAAGVLAGRTHWTDRIVNGRRRARDLDHHVGVGPAEPRR